MKFLKNFLISIILLGIITTPLNPVFAAETATGGAVGAGTEATGAAAGVAGAVEFAGD